MMKDLKKRLFGVYKDNTGIKEEDFECNYESDPLEAYKKVIVYFNDTLRPHESPRTAISARWEESEPIINYYCEFEKVNMMTQKDSRGYYDRWKCKHCGKVRRRYGLGGKEIDRVTCGKQRREDKEDYNILKEEHDSEVSL